MKYQTPDDWDWTSARKSRRWVALHRGWKLEIKDDAWEGFNAYVYRTDESLPDVLIAALTGMPSVVQSKRWCEGVARGVEMAPENTSDETPHE